MIYLKSLFLFLILQQLSYRTSLRGFLINWNGLHHPIMALPCLALFLWLYPSPDFASHWVLLLVPVAFVSMMLATLFPTPGFSMTSEKRTTANGTEYYYFPSKLKSEHKTMVFFHGSGNDALFDNYELFNGWIKKGCSIVAVNLPGHGLNGKSILDPENPFEPMENAWLEIKKELELNSATLVGESLGAKYALLLALQEPLISECHLLCYPSAVNLSKLGLVWEFIHFFGFQLWWRLQSNTFWEAIPSFSHFKRKLYPVRHTLPSGTPSIQVYRKTIETMEYLILNILKALEGSEGFASRKMKVKLFHGLLDGIIPYTQSYDLSNKLSQSNIPNEKYFVRGTHLSIKKWAHGYYND